jgi:hypothetical protein
MTIKKKGSRDSETALPNGGHVPVTGLNYGLDGFDFDTEYGDGVADGAALPEAYGLSDLPEGILPEDRAADELEADVINVKAPLKDMMSNPWGMKNMAFDAVLGDGSDITVGGSLADLNWLDPTLEQEPERLPDNPDTVSELEDAWGIDRRTDGVSLIPNKDRAIAEYQKTLVEPVKSGLPGSGVLATVQKLMRRQAFGRINTAALDLLASNNPGLAAAIRADDHLAGNVFIRASAFPGMINGRWDDKIRRHCSNAAFILAERGSKMASLDRYLGKEVVTEIPWSRAVNHYESRLEASGRKLATSKNFSAKDRLQRAFSQKPVSSSGAISANRTASRDDQRTGVPRVSKAVALAELANSGNSQEVILGSNIQDALDKLDQDHADALGRLAQRVVSRRYNGSETDLRIAEGRPRHPKNPGNAEESIQGSRAEKVVADIRKLVARGILSDEAAEAIVANGGTADAMMRAAATAVSSSRGKYAGPKFTRAPASKKAIQRSAEDERILEASKTSGIKASEFRGITRWARKAMSEGSAGSDFSQLIRARFSKRLLKAASPMLKELKAAHEGISGHVYVDAGAYESAKGTEGCDRGADRHRTNAIPYVLRIAKCDSCVFCNQDGGCQKYNKPLIASPSDVVEDPETYKRIAIHQADASDAETTASLFAGSYDPSEFGLHNAGMDDIGFDEAPEHDELGGFVFGGLLIGGDSE